LQDDAEFDLRAAIETDRAEDDDRHAVPDARSGIRSETR
jgi:hypothetical protein